MASVAKDFKLPGLQNSLRSRPLEVGQRPTSPSSIPRRGWWQRSKRVSASRPQVANAGLNAGVVRTAASIGIAAAFAWFGSGCSDGHGFCPRGHLSQPSCASALGCSDQHGIFRRPGGILAGGHSAGVPCRAQAHNRLCAWSCRLQLPRGSSHRLGDGSRRICR